MEKPINVLSNEKIRVTNIYVYIKTTLRLLPSSKQKKNDNVRFFFHLKPVFVLHGSVLQFTSVKNQKNIYTLHLMSPRVYVCWRNASKLFNRTRQPSILIQYKALVRVFRFLSFDPYFQMYLLNKLEYSMNVHIKRICLLHNSIFEINKCAF